MKIKIAGHGEPPTLAERADLTLRFTVEPLVELGRGAKVLKTDAASQGQAAVRTIAIDGFVIFAPAPQRVELDGLDLHGVEGDFIGTGGCRSGKNAEPTSALRKHDAPLERVHGAHGSANHGRPGVDVEKVGEKRLHIDLVANRGERKARGPLGAIGSE